MDAFCIIECGLWETYSMKEDICLERERNFS